MGTMPVVGSNMRDFPQLLDTNSALFIENYWIHSRARLVKRSGTQEYFDTGDSDLVTGFIDYQLGYEIEAHGHKANARLKSTGAFTSIKSDFTSGAYLEALRTGDYAFINSDLDGLWRVNMQITYSERQTTPDTNVFYVTNTGGALGATITGGTSGATATVTSSTGTTPRVIYITNISGTFQHGEPIISGSLANGVLAQINPFAVGEKLTFGTSGATATVLEHTDDGATGTLVLGSISTAIQSGETITGSLEGLGTTTSIVTFNTTHVSAAPKARHMAYDGKRLWLYDLISDSSGWVYSAVDSGTNPPFTNFTTASTADGGGSGTFRRGEGCNKIVFLGDINFLAFEKGWYAFKISTIDSGGVISKVDQLVQLSDVGIDMVSVTDVGLIAVGDFGVKRLVSLGQPNVPYSEQWEMLTEQLGQSYFDDVNFDDASIVYDDGRGYIYISCAKGGGTTENLIIAIKADIAGLESTVKTGATSFFTGLNPYRLFKIGSEIYFADALDGRIVHLFEGENDEGSSIYSEYYQELSFGEIKGILNLDEMSVYGEFTNASTLNINFDRFDPNSHFENTIASYSWSPYNDYSSGGGWGSSAWSSSAWGATGTSSGLTYDKADLRPRINNAMRVRVRFTCEDSSDHTLNMFTARASISGQSRSHKLTQV